MLARTALLLAVCGLATAQSATQTLKKLLSNGRLGAGLEISVERCPQKKVTDPDYVGISIPESYDWTMDAANANCVPYIQDQKSCGSCWAFSTAWAMSARFCKASNGTIKVSLSPQDFVTCDQTCKLNLTAFNMSVGRGCNAGCSGGWIDNAINYMQDTGVTTWTSLPYTNSNGTGTCPTSTRLRSLNCSSLGSNGGDHKLIKAEIIKNGPVVATMTVYSSLESYKSGVWAPAAADTNEGGHAIVIVGWGTDAATGKDYWTIANSWGSGWGLKGYGWIAANNAQVGLGTYVASAKPDLSSPGTNTAAFNSGFSSAPRTSAPSTLIMAALVFVVVSLLQSM